MVHHWKEDRTGNKDRNWRQEPLAKAAYELAHWTMLGHLAYTSQAHLPKDGATHSGLYPPTSITTTNMDTGYSDLGGSSVEIFSSQATLDLRHVDN